MHAQGTGHRATGLSPCGRPEGSGDGGGKGGSIRDGLIEYRTASEAVMMYICDGTRGKRDTVKIGVSQTVLVIEKMKIWLVCVAAQ